MQFIIVVIYEAVRAFFKKKNQIYLHFFSFSSFFKLPNAQALFQNEIKAQHGVTVMSRSYILTGANVS